MSKRIIIHCSTNAGTSNFGDVIFSEMILKHLQDSGYEASFYDVSDYLNNYLYEVKALHKDIVALQEADGAIYFAGGYFGEKKNERIDRSIRHYLRFMKYGELVLKYHKPLAIIGIGAGPALWYPSQRIVTKACNAASILTTRDNESADYLKSIGVSSPIRVCSDVAQTYSLPTGRQIKGVSVDESSEYIFLHTNYQQDVSDLFARSIKSYISNHPNTRVIVGADNVVNIDNAVQVAKNILGNEKVLAYNYSEPDDLCALLNRCNLILTYKLHVGIISATLGRSVIAVSKHEKIQRYYKQIGEQDRCVDFVGCTSELLEGKVARYYGKGISLNQQILNQAYENWQLLDGFLASLG